MKVSSRGVQVFKIALCSCRRTSKILKDITAATGSIWPVPNHAFSREAMYKSQPEIAYSFRLIPERGVQKICDEEVHEKERKGSYLKR